MPPELPPVELPEPEPEPMLPLLEPPLVPVLGEDGAGAVLVLPLVELPLAPVPALEPDLLKWASHSAREICPSLLVSTAEKLGAEVLEAPAAAPPPDDGVADEPLDMPDEPLELEPEAAGEDDDLSLLVLLEELCAIAAPESANSAAAVAALSSFRFNIGWFLHRGIGKTAPAPMQDTYRDGNNQPA